MNQLDRHPILPSPISSLKPLELVERAAIIETLNDFGWVRSHTADHLEMTRTTLWRKMKAYGISEESGGRSGELDKEGPVPPSLNFRAVGFRLVACSGYAILMLDNFEIGDSVGGWPKGLPRKLTVWADKQLKVKSEE